MSRKSLKPVLEEIARPDPLGLQYYTYYDTPSQLLRSEGASSRYFRDIYDLYSDMEDKDAHLFAVLQTRKNGVLCRPRKIVAASESRRDQEVADFIRAAVGSMNSFDGAMLSLLDAIGKGFAVVEVLWNVNRGAIGVDALKVRPQGRFRFSKDGRLMLRGQPGLNLARRDDFPTTSSTSPSPTLSKSSGILCDHTVPPRKFLMMQFNATAENPYGRGLLAKAYWYYWFKKNNLKFWVLFNEKFGAPTIIGKYRIGASEEERNRLFEVVQSLQNDTGVTIPENLALEFLEAKRSGTINTYRDLCDWCNDEISKLTLGATLSTGEGRRSGSLALGKVHERVRSEYVEADARNLMEVINNQLIRWLVDFNFGTDVHAPRLYIDTTEDENLAEEIRVDQELIKLGVPLSLSYFYERYKRPAPLPEERALRYDDNNLYQYHLQYGVLTINEVRKTLGLPPVSWGDEPPAKGDVTGINEMSPEEKGRQGEMERRDEE